MGRRGAAIGPHPVSFPFGDAGLASLERRRLPWPGGVTGGGETPALMPGSAGTGYLYLRLFDPAVPSVLLLLPRAASARPGLS